MTTVAAGSDLVAYRDDGLLAALLGRTAGSWISGARDRAGALPVTLAGAVPVAAVGIPHGPRWALAVAIGWYVLAAGAGSGMSHARRLSWLLPCLLRGVEYAVLLRITALAEPRALPLCFALLAALAFHHYDTIFRLESQRRPPPTWLRFAGGGWDLRLLAAGALFVAGGLPTGLAVGAVGLGLLYVGESAASWIGLLGVPQQARHRRHETLDR